MIRLLSIPLLLACSFQLFSQSVPLNFPYQTVVRDLQGQPLAYRMLPVEVELIAEWSRGDSHTVYLERHRVLSDANGLVQIVIGEGINKDLEFSEVPWHEGDIWLKLRVDLDGNGVYTELENTRLLSVPYALRSHSAGKVSGYPQQNGNQRYSYYEWKTGGNTGSNPSQHFLGNWDAKDLVFRTSNTERMRILAGGDVDMPDHLNVGDDLQVTGHMDIGGGAHFGDSLAVDGDVIIGGDLNLQGAVFQAHLSVVFDSAKQVSSFHNLNNGDGDGIAVKLGPAKTSQENNYMTFYNGDGDVAGTIEGYDYNLYDIDVPIPSSNAIREAFCKYLTSLNPVYWAMNPFASQLNLFGSNWNIASISPTSIPDVPAISIPQILITPGFCIIYEPYPPFDCAVSFPSVTFPALQVFDGLPLPDIPEFDFSDQVAAFPTLPLLSDFVCPSGALAAYLYDLAVWTVENDAEDMLTTSPSDLLLAAAIWELKRQAQDGGVVYGSKGADYAEWLEKEDPKADYFFGQIVGVRNGKISLVTEGAEQVMTVSLHPAAVGNSPDKARLKDYEMVAFMGQVPVMVKGGCKSGDFIVASGSNDGIGTAVRPQDLQSGQLKYIAGRALEDCSNERFDMVRLMAGVKTNEWKEIFQQQEARIKELETKLQRIEKIQRDIEMIDSLLHQRAQLGETNVSTRFENTDKE